MSTFKPNTSVVKIEVSVKQIFRIFALIALIVLSLKLYHVIILLLISFILMAALRPAALYLNKKLHLPKPLAIILVYLLVIILFICLIAVVSYPLGNEVKRLGENLPGLIDSIVKRFPFLKDRVDLDSLERSFSSVSSNLANSIQSILNFTLNALHFFVELISVIIISIYLFLDRENILKFAVKVFKLDPENFYKTYERVENQLGAWVRGQLLLGIIVGVMMWVGLSIAGVKYALPLAFLAGIFEMVPIIGPIISTIPIALIGFNQSLVKGFLGIFVAIFVQQTEGHLLVPQVMKRAVGLSPVVTLVSLLVGSQLLGVLGALLSVPFAAIISVLLEVYLERSRIKINPEKL